MKKKPKWTQIVLAVLFQTLSIATIIGQAAVWLLSTRVSLFPGQEAMQSIASSFAEIVAGLYGLTLASYTFFLSRIDGLAANNPTLEYVTGGLKRKFKYLIWHITFQVLMTLTFATILIYADAPQPGSSFGFWYRLFCNEFILFSGFSIVLILYYSVLVVDPKSIEKEAARLKRKLGGKEKDGSVLEFLALYRKILQKTTELIPQEMTDPFWNGRAVERAVAIALLQKHYSDTDTLIQNLEIVHRYYEAMVNCKEISVSRKMCDAAAELLVQLEEPPKIPETQEEPSVPGK